MPPRNDEQEVDLENALAEAFDEMESDDSDVEEEDVEEAEISEEGDAEEIEEGDEAASEEQQDEEVAQDEELKGEIEDAAESDYTEPAPERWPAEIKQVYNELPPQARKAMLEGIYKPMQAQYTKSTQQLAQMRKQVEPMLKSLDQYRNDFERMGMNPQEAFQRQVAWAAHFARVGPEQGLKDMQEAYGLGAKQEGQQEEQYLTPVERAMKAKLDALEQTVQSSQQQTVQQQQAAQQQQYQRRYTEVTKGLQDFINETKDGKPAHPHVEKVAPAIAGLIRGGLVRTTDDYGQPVPVRDQLNAAYRMACDMNPSIRTASTGSQSRQVAKAKAAGSVGVVAKNAASQSDVSGRSLMDDLEETFDKMSRTG